MKTHTTTVKKVLSIGVSVALWGSLFVPLVPAQAAIGDWQKGASFIPSSPTDFSSSTFQQSVQNFKADGGTYVSLIIPYYQSNTGSTDIAPGYNTPTDQSLIDGINYVHSLGMHAQIAFYLETYSGDWRAYINPGDRNTWYQKYGADLVHYGQIAQQTGAEQFVLGAELIDMASPVANSDNTERWDAMIAAVRAVYSGSLTYSANRGNTTGDWASEAWNIQFWDKLNYIGVSPYYTLGGDGSVASLESDWQSWNNNDIAPLSQKWGGKQILFTEIGYRSVSGTHNNPWDSWDGGSYDPQEQVNDYTALFDFWNNQPYIAGIDLWWWSPNPSYGGSGNTDYTPQGKPAEGVMKQYWLNNNSGSSSGTTNTGGGNTGTSVFTSTGSASPSTPTVGQNTTLTANVTDTGSASSGDIIDLEVYQGSSQVFQQYFSGQNFSSGGSQQVKTNWTPGSTGTYTLEIGVFNGNWSQTYTWNSNAASITVGQSSSSSGSTSGSSSGTVSGNQVTDIWWPSNGAHVSGTQPFKAMLENVDVSQYNMFWQVDKGGLVPMYTSTQDYPHKEAMVDLSGWTWDGAGPYTINFVSKDNSGNVISQKSTQIWIP